ncbi:MAG: hypothetical protein IIX11_01415 [Selenomonadales bacterium]|nr:hypothetical protein [Selenomonadales bacterium]
MRDAHKARALPNKKLPRGIERQDELLELIEKRFHQEDLIRTALNKKDEANAEANADETASSAAESNAPAADASDDPSAEKTADPAEATATAGDDPSADTGEAPSADAGDAPYADASETPSATAGDTAETVTIRWHGQNETITDPRTWLTVFDTVRKAGDVITREVADRRFHGESYWKTCDALYLSTGTYYHHVRAILHYAFACAVYHRLIDPRPKHPFPKAM